MNYRQLFDGLKSGKPIQIYDYALAVEDNTRKLYLKLAESAQDRDLKEFFQKMVKEETDHFNLLAERYISMFEAIEGVLDFPRQLDIEGLVEFDIDVEKTGMPVSISHALEIALEGEKLAYTFYRGTELLAMDSEAQAVLHELMLIEKKHVEMVEEIIEAQL